MRQSFFLTSKIECNALNFVKRVVVFAVQLYALIISHSFVVYNIKIKNIFRIPHFRFFRKNLKFAIDKHFLLCYNMARISKGYDEDGQNIASPESRRLV
jgi:hypothetical protein